MAEEYAKTIEVLTKELEELVTKEIELKKMINWLSEKNGQKAPYKNLDVASAVKRTTLRQDQFFGMKVTTAVREFLRMKGHAVSIDEIYEGLTQGGFDFPWDEKNQKRNLAISISKNPGVFVHVSSNDSWGLVEFYPELQRKRQLKKTQGDEPEETGAETDESNKEEENK